MKLTVVSFGHKRDDLFHAAVDDYARRLVRPWSLLLVDLPGERGASAEVVMAREASALEQRELDLGRAWLLDVTGKALSTEELAASLQRAHDTSERERVFVIGGAFGLHPRLGERCKNKLSLSRMTLPHRLARVVLVEQLYRAVSIIRGEPYHK